MVKFPFCHPFNDTQPGIVRGGRRDVSFSLGEPQVSHLQQKGENLGEKRGI